MYVKMFSATEPGRDTSPNWPHAAIPAQLLPPLGLALCTCTLSTLDILLAPIILIVQLLIAPIVGLPFPFPLCWPLLSFRYWRFLLFLRSCNVLVLF